MCWCWCWHCKAMAEYSVQEGVMPCFPELVFAAPSSMPSSLKKVGADSSCRSEPDFTLSIFGGNGQFNRIDLALSRQRTSTQSGRIVRCRWP